MNNKVVLSISMIMAAMFFAACNNGGSQAKRQPETKNSHTGSGTKTELETVFSDSTYQLTGVAITRDGRLFTNYPYWSEQHKYAVVEINKDGSVKPYPDTAWNSFKKGEDGQNKLVCAQAVYADDKGYLWIVDPAGINLGPVYKNAAKVLKVRLSDNVVEQVYRFPASVVATSNYINDIRVDHKTGFAYMTISSDGGLIAFDIHTGAARKVLTRDKSTHADENRTMMVDGKPFLLNGKPAHFHSDGIALSPDGAWLYYKAITDKRLFRVPTRLLRDFNVAETDIASAVESLGAFTTTDGMEMDKKGNLYLGDLESGSIIRVSPQLTMETLYTAPEVLRWADSYSISDDGYLYISTSQIQFMAMFNKGKALFNGRPFQIFRLKISG